MNNQEHVTKGQSVLEYYASLDASYEDLDNFTDLVADVLHALIAKEDITEDNLSQCLDNAWNHFDRERNEA